jgi:hypothetical protein
MLEAIHRWENEGGALYPNDLGASRSGVIFRASGPITDDARTRGTSRPPAHDRIDRVKPETDVLSEER